VRALSGMCELGDILKDEWKCNYDTWIGEERVLRAWLRYENKSGSTGRANHLFRLWQESQFSRADVKTLTRSEATLRTVSPFRPKSYSVWVAGQRVLSIGFSRGRYSARLYDGTEVSGRAQRPDIVLPANMLPVLAVLLRFLNRCWRSKMRGCVGSWKPLADTTTS